MADAFTRPAFHEHLAAFNERRALYPDKSEFWHSGYQKAWADARKRPDERIVPEPEMGADYLSGYTQGQFDCGCHSGSTQTDRSLT